MKGIKKKREIFRGEIVGWVRVRVGIFSWREWFFWEEEDCGSRFWVGDFVVL